MGSISFSYGSQLWLKGKSFSETIWSVPVSGIPSGASISSVTLVVDLITTTNASGNISIYKGESNIAANRVLYRTAGAYNESGISVDLSSYITGNGNFPLLFRKNANSSGTQSNVCFGVPVITINYVDPVSTFTLSSTSINAGDTLTVNITRANSSYTHIVRYGFGTHSEDIKNVATSSSFAIPESWLDAIPNNTSGTGQVTIFTYSDSTFKTQLGYSSKTFTLKCPSSVKPSIGDVTVSVLNGGHWGLCVQNYDGVKITVGSGKYAAGTGAKVTSIDIYGAGYNSSKQDTTGAGVTGDVSLTTGNITASGDVSFTVLVTDSRGRWTAKTLTQYVTPYFAPQITSPICYRSDSNKVAQPASGTSVTIGCTYSCASIGSNSASLRAQYRRTDSDWIEINNFSCASGATVVALDGELSTSIKYEFKIIATDSFGVNAATIITVPSSQVFMRWDKDGDAIGFGCIPQGKKRVELDEWDLVVGGTNVGDKLSVVTPVYNQLDNSNFANPVNQRGLSFYNTAGSYCIDRWIVASLDSKGVVNVGSGYVALCNTTNDYVDLQQILPNASGLKGMDMTFAVKMNGVDDPLILNFTFGTYKHATFSDDKIALIHWNEDRVIIRAQNTGETWYGFTWAALYVGTFTVDTLPYYVPRGYVDEYHECCRYYYQVPSSSIYAYPGYFASSTLAQITISTPMRMRVVPSVSVETIANCVMFSGSGSFTPTDVSVLGRQLDAVCLGFTVSGATSRTACNARFNTTISLSADL